MGALFGMVPHLLQGLIQKGKAQLPQGHFGVAPVPNAPDASGGLNPNTAAPPVSAAPGQAPQLHGWRRALDVAGQYLAPGLEEQVPGTPGNFALEQHKAR